MAATAKLNLKQVVSAIGEAGVRIVRSDTGRHYLSYPGLPGTGPTIKECKTDKAIDSVFRVLVDKDLSVSRSEVSDALAYIRGGAEDSAPVPVFNRVATHDGSIYLDLGDPKRRVVRIEPGHWSIAADYPVLFNRPATLIPLPDPTKGGSIDELKRLLKFDEDLWLLYLGAILANFNQVGPHFLTVIQGPSGVGKSTIAEILAGLVDPRRPQLTRVKGDLKALMVAGHNRWVLALDNLTPLSPNLSGDLCSIVTGSGMDDRLLWTDSDVSSISLRNPVVINGISGLLARDEVRTRSVPISIPPRDEYDPRLLAKVESHHAAILGGLLDMVAAGLKLRGKLEDTWRTRTAAGEEFVEQCFRGMGWGSGLFTSALARARGAVAREGLDSWPLFPELLAAAECNADLLAEQMWDVLTERFGEGPLPTAGPSSASAFGKQLSSRKSDLTAAGIEFTTTRTKEGTRYRFRLRQETTENASVPLPPTSTSLVSPTP